MKVVGLKAFAEKRKAAQVKCTACQLPKALLQEINDGWRDGVSMGAIREYLKAKGRDMYVEKHFAAGHAGKRVGRE